MMEEFFDAKKSYKNPPWQAIHTIPFNEFKELCASDTVTVIDWCGRMVASPRDKPYNDRQLKELYDENLRAAISHGYTPNTPDHKPQTKEQEVMTTSTLPAPVLNHKGKPFSWSFSAINDFDPELGGCPQKYAQARFYCTTKWVETEALRWGNEVHKALENRIKHGTELPDGMKQYEKYATALLGAADGHKILAEDRIALNRKFGVTGYFDKDAWGRGSVDVLILRDETALIFDYKTGKPKASDLQLKIYAAMVALKYPHIQKFVPKFIFLKHDKILPEKANELVLTRADIAPILVDVLNRTKRMEEAWATENFPCMTSGLCGWCDSRRGCDHYDGKR